MIDFSGLIVYYIIKERENNTIQVDGTGTPSDVGLAEKTDSFLKKLSKKHLTNLIKKIIIKSEKRKGEKTMRKEEIKAKIEELETRKFFNNMVDRWTWENREIDRELTKEIAKLKAQL